MLVLVLVLSSVVKLFCVGRCVRMVGWFIFLMCLSVSSVEVIVVFECFMLMVVVVWFFLISWV